MRIFTNKNFIQKLIIAIVCVILINFCIAPKTQAKSSFGGKMMDLMISFVTAITDVAASLVQLGLTGNWVWATDNAGEGIVTVKSNGSENEDLDYWEKEKKIKYPILQISPEVIFANKVQLLDANFISDIKSSDNYLVALEDTSALKTLRNIIAGWYVTLRTIAIVGLLSVLIYVGIRIIISSTASDKAKYKQRLIDWIIAFCLLFFMHYIMAATITVVEKINDTLSNATKVEEGLDLLEDFGYVVYNPTGVHDETGMGVFGAIGNYDYDDFITDRLFYWKFITNYGSGDLSLADFYYGSAIYDQNLLHIDYSEDGKDIYITLTDKDYETELAKIKITIKTDNFSGYSTQAVVIGGSAELLSGDSSYFDLELINNEFAGLENELTELGYSIIESGSEILSDNGKTVTVDSVSGAKIRVATASIQSYEDETTGKTIPAGSKILYFTNFARLYLNSADDDEYLPMAVAYLIIYVALIAFTVMFALRYIKRVIYIAFLTLMAPLVALTYPLDKMRDRKSSSLGHVV